MVLVTVVTATAQTPSSKPVNFRYVVSLADASSHLLHIQMQIPGGTDDRIVRLPVWNALYQVRDFAQYIQSISAADFRGMSLPVEQIETSAWRVSGAKKGAVISYDIYADNPGPYGAQANDHHAFLNLAEVLIYEPGQGRHSPLSLQFANIPEGWSPASALPGIDERLGGTRNVSFSADSYDQLVDNPIELGEFHEVSFQDGKTSYRIAIDADPADYDDAAIENSARRIVHVETEWMKEQPCSTYVFIYHFPHGRGGGGMEHTCSTAIDVEASRMNGGDTSAFDAVTAHEFFHLWNVKRIRPQSLEPIDYTKEQYTRALWFSEGVTSTVEDIILLRSGLITSDEYLRRLSDEINTLQDRPAHRTQSAEQSSLDAWLEKYAFYRRPERSVSYYNKGEILGVMLDLAVRDATSGSKSLRDAFLWMNDNYARKSTFFADSEGVRAAVEAVSGKDFKDFFERYVSGTDEIPYDQFLNTAGLHLREGEMTVPDPGFGYSRNFDAAPTVLSVRSGSDADRAGLKPGDTIISANGKASLSDVLAGVGPGNTLHLRLRSGGQEHEVKFKIGAKGASRYSIAEAARPTPAQLKRRAEWLASSNATAEQQGAKRK